MYIYIYIYIPNTMEAKWATLESIGLRSVEAVAKHILQKNVWESNLIPDIAGVDYFAGHHGRTNLQPLDELYPNENPAAYFVTKVDVSELPMEKLQKGLPAMRRLLMSVGCGLYQIDYTQDFSGTLVRPALVQYLVRVPDFFQQGQFAFPENGGCILDNTDSVGDHVCTFVQTRNGRTASTKFYNKVMCQFEAVDVRESFGGHLAHYIDSTNRHLPWTMLHPDVQRRGCTRLEISLYACDTECLSQTVAEELIAEALELANTEEGLFVVQPPAKQWENLAQHLDRPLGDHPQGALYLAWSGHSKTGGVQGMLVKPTAEKVADDAGWERAMQWTMGDFGPYFTRRLWERKAERCYFRLFAASQKSGQPFLQRAKGRASCIQARPTHKIYYRQQGM